MLAQILREAKADLAPHADADDELFLRQVIAALLQFQRIEVLRARQRATLKRHLIADIHEIDLVRAQRRQFLHRDFLFRLPIVDNSGHISCNLPFHFIYHSIYWSKSVTIWSSLRFLARYM